MCTFFWPGFFCLMHFWDSHIFLCISVVCFFWLLSRIQLCGHIPIVGWWTFELFSVGAVINISYYKHRVQFFWGHIFSFLLGKYWEVKWPEVCIWLFNKLPCSSLKGCHIFILPLAKYESSTCSTLLSTFVFHTPIVQCFNSSRFIVVPHYGLMCISLMTIDDKYLLVCLPII